MDHVTYRKIMESVRNGSRSKYVAAQDLMLMCGLRTATAVSAAYGIKLVGEHDDVQKRASRFLRAQQHRLEAEWAASDMLAAMPESARQLCKL